MKMDTTQIGVIIGDLRKFEVLLGDRRDIAGAYRQLQRRADDFVAVA